MLLSLDMQQNVAYNMLEVIIVQRLIELRKKADKTQKEMADILGISRQAYAHYEADQREPDYSMLKKISAYFNVSIDYLLDNGDKNEGGSLKSSTLEKFGEELRSLREQQGLSLSALAEQLDVSTRTLYSIEQFRAQPTLTLAKQLAEYFDVSIDHLLGREEKEKPAASDELLSDPQNREFLQLYSMLTPEERQFVMAAIKGILSKR